MFLDHLYQVGGMWGCGVDVRRLPLHGLVFSRVNMCVFCVRALLLGFRTCSSWRRPNQQGPQCVRRYAVKGSGGTKHARKGLAYTTVDGIVRRG